MMETSSPEVLGTISVFDFGVRKSSLAIPQVRGVFDGQHRALAAGIILDKKESNLTLRFFWKSFQLPMSRN